MRIAAMVVVTCLSAAAAAAQAGGQAQGTDQARGGAKAQASAAGNAAIRQVADAYVKATIAGDAAAVGALYTEDAVEMPPNQPMVKGRTAIQQYYEKIFSSGMKMTTFTLDHLDTRGSGDAAYDVGTYHQSMAQPSAASPTSDSGKYVVILKRTGGAWKVAYAIYNSDQAPAPGR